MLTCVLNEKKRLDKVVVKKRMVRWKEQEERERKSKKHLTLVVCEVH